MGRSPPRPSPIPRPLTHLRGLLLIIPWLAYLLVADIILSLLLLLKPFRPDTVYDASSAVAWTVWRWIQAVFEGANGADVEVSVSVSIPATGGDSLPPGESAVVVANHVGWCDFYMIQALAMRSGMLGRCRWFAKVQLRRVPFLGWGLWAMGMPMVSRKWMRDRLELDRVFGGIVERRWPVWLISFSEATRFTPAKYAESQAWCAANSRPQPQHLLYPRTKGFVATVQHLRRAPHVRAVYDVAIAYERDGQWHIAPDMWETLSLPHLSRPAAAEGGRGFRFHVHVRRFPMEELPTDDEGLATWLEQRWVEKGEWLEAKRVEWAQENRKKES
ncbi:1-acyl-sn-glycerol-3-phosphate acyltransferase [Phialemonium atrogriseum]|uniref:1-acyl-sn-glycerol-3-phosphate acyltransferase n=1 Tax=Phialemonium atrogriseum TaxID=1093897 RepID=A0AAJ0BWH5_9PEZI|nr:1-acyl-sn-glycerol-3-phosphate acyltransferase [Phialemonium atrogriseum]KAK1764703.1 1-acyl-sn-glycerol-3-phosphate acyltransferase [Phialemonium atrogriseum]